MKKKNKDFYEWLDSVGIDMDIKRRHAVCSTRETSWKVKLCNVYFHGRQMPIDHTISFYPGNVSVEQPSVSSAIRELMKKIQGKTIVVFSKASPTRFTGRIVQVPTFYSGHTRIIDLKHKDPEDLMFDCSLLLLIVQWYTKENLEILLDTELTDEEYEEIIERWNDGTGADEGAQIVKDTVKGYLKEMRQ